MKKDPFDITAIIDEIRAKKRRSQFTLAEEEKHDRQAIFNESCKDSMGNGCAEVDNLSHSSVKELPVVPYRPLTIGK